MFELSVCICNMLDPLISKGVKCLKRLLDQAFNWGMNGSLLNSKSISGVNAFTPHVYSHWTNVSLLLYLYNPINFNGAVQVY